MKRLFYLVICTGLLISCNQNNNQEATNDSLTHDEANTTALSLNNGAKWKADTATNQHVTDLRTIADNFKIQPSPSLNEYAILGNDLNNSLQKMIQECKMTGADHEALHHWLEPVLKETNELKNTKDATAARKNFDHIDAQIDAFHTYFE